MTSPEVLMLENINNVHLWHKVDIAAVLNDVCFRG
jgi:hypothetical protein